MILVTGGTGFLGQKIIAELLQNGHAVRALVRNPEGRELPWGNQAEIAEGDVMDVMALERAMKGVDYVIHAAAIVSFTKEGQKEMMKVNVQGTANVVDMAVAEGIKKMIHVSSTAAIGRTGEKKIISEETKWKEHPLNAKYAVSKHRAELEVYRGIAEGLYAEIVNPGLIMGDGDWEHGSAKIFHTVAKGLKFYNVGVNGVVSVYDVAGVIRKLLAHEGKNGSRYLLVAENLSQKELFGKIATSLNQKPPQIQFPPWLSMMAGYGMEFLSKITGKKPIVTRETMRTSIHEFRYDGSKVTRELDFSYTPIDEVMQETAKKYLAR